MNYNDYNAFGWRLISSNEIPFSKLLSPHWRDQVEAYIPLDFAKVKVLKIKEAGKRTTEHVYISTVSNIGLPTPPYSMEEDYLLGETIILSEAHYEMFNKFLERAQAGERSLLEKMIHSIKDVLSKTTSMRRKGNIIPVNLESALA